MSRLLASLLGVQFRDEAEGGTGGTGAAGGDKGAAGDAGKGAAGAGDAGKGAEGGEGGTGAAGDAAKAGLIAEARRAATGAAQATIPDKFVVKNAAGEIDHKATLDKLYPSYTELEKRAGQGALGMPPATADEYKLELAAGETKLPELDAQISKDFRAHAKAMGLNQAQYNQMVRVGNAIIEQVVGGVEQANIAQIRTGLIEHYGSEKAYTKALGDAFTAYGAYADEADMAEIDSIGNNPAFIRVMARVRADMREDRVPNFNPTAAANEAAAITELTGNLKSAYWDPKLPGHAAAVAKVQAWHERQAQQGQRKTA